MIVLVYVAAYAFYNLNDLNILYAVVPWNQGSYLLGYVSEPPSNPATFVARKPEGCARLFSELT